MVNMVGRQVGEIFDMLKELGIDNNTLVIVSGDNGGQHYFKSKDYPEGVFNPNGHVFRGQKRDLLEGGLQIPFIARLPGKIPAGKVTEHLCYFPDVMPTLAEATKTTEYLPPALDGISFLSTLRKNRLNNSG